MMNNKKILLQQNVLIILKLNIFKNMNETIFIYFLSFFLKLTLNVSFNLKKKMKLLSIKKKIYNNNINCNISKNNKVIKFFNNFNNLFIYSNTGKKSDLEIIGYIRRAWYKKKKRLIILRLGHSYYNSNIIPNKVLFRLSKKRLLYFFSNNISFLHQFSNYIRKLKPTDSYKLAGIIQKNQKISLKKSKKQQAGSSY